MGSTPAVTNLANTPICFTIPVVCNSNSNMTEEVESITFVEFRLQQDKEILKEFELFLETK